MNDHSKGWRASCMYMWNTTEGGPCVLRPILPTAWDAPNPDQLGQGRMIKFS